jgi:hypothetical protein
MFDAIGKLFERYICTLETVRITGSQTEISMFARLAPTSHRVGLARVRRR